MHLHSFPVLRRLTNCLLIMLALDLQGALHKGWRSHGTVHLPSLDTDCSAVPAQIDRVEIESRSSVSHENINPSNLSPKQEKPFPFLLVAKNPATMRLVRKRGDLCMIGHSPWLCHDLHFPFLTPAASSSEVFSELRITVHSG